MQNMQNMRICTAGDRTYCYGYYVWHYSHHNKVPNEVLMKYR
jgi:hypothetical protein